MLNAGATESTTVRRAEGQRPRPDNMVVVSTILDCETSETRELRSRSEIGFRRTREQVLFADGLDFEKRQLVIDVILGGQ